MKKITGIESYGDNGSFKAEVNIDSEKYDALTEEAQMRVSFKAQDGVDAIMHMIEMEWAKAFKHANRAAHAMSLEKLFTDAGFGVVHVKIIDNQYSDNACYYANPWIIVTTTLGPITLGWRKRVINLDWSESDISADGRELFKQESTTSSERYVHCWGEDKAVEYLRKLLTC